MLINYIPARLTTGKTWFVSYYVENPETKKLIRKRIKLNRIRSVSERRKFARQLIHKLNIKLAEGWNPFIEQEATKTFAKLNEAIGIYLSFKERELRPDSMRSYRSIAKSLLNYINNEDLSVFEFTRHYAIDYLKELYLNRKVTEVVYNNHRNFGRGLFNWMIENQYCKANPFLQIKTKKERAKTRIPIDSFYRNKIKEFLENNLEYEYLAICMLTYYTFLRPSEICHLKKNMFDFARQLIILPPEICKDGEKRIVTIPDQLIPYLSKLKIPLINDDLYIFSMKYKPGKILRNSRYVARRWDKLRKEIGMPMEMQFYSLKDTGIVQMLRNGVSPEIVRDQAGHSSLEVTNKYIKLANSEADEQIKSKSGGF